jgi:hypothetical protein
MLVTTIRDDVAKRFSHREKLAGDKLQAQPLKDIFLVGAH